MPTVFVENGVIKKLCHICRGEGYIECGCVCGKCNGEGNIALSFQDTLFVKEILEAGLDVNFRTGDIEFRNL